ncbi:MAG: TRAP transporter substrate-binding protein DctP [Spirochaetia bacterium]
MKKVLYLLLVIGITAAFSACQTTSAKTETETIADVSNTIAEQLLAEFDRESIKNVAVLPFIKSNSDKSGSEEPDDFSAYLSDELINSLFIKSDREIVIFERSQIDRLMEEYELASSGLVSQQTAAEFGKLIGVDAVVIGTVREVSDTVRINARSVKVETGEIAAVAAADVPLEVYTAVLNNPEKVKESQDRIPEELRQVEARFVTEEGDGDFMTVFARRFADFMNEKTGGDFKVEVYPYGTLDDDRDINELTKMGVVELLFTNWSWITAHVPETGVLGLHYLWPEQRTPEVLEWVVQNGEIMPLLEKAFRRQGLVPLSIMYEGHQWLTSREPSATVEDLEGQRVRIMDSPVLDINYGAYGMEPEPIGLGGVIPALEEGELDAQLNPLFFVRTMNFHRHTNYFTQMYAEPFFAIPAVNMIFFDKLPEEQQQLMYDFFQNNIQEAAEWIDEKNAEARDAIERERPEIVWTEWNEGETEKAAKRAQAARDEYREIAGEAGIKAMEILLDDIEEAKAALD